MHTGDGFVKNNYVKQNWWKKIYVKYSMSIYLLHVSLKGYWRIKLLIIITFLQGKTRQAQSEMEQRHQDENCPARHCMWQGKQNSFKTFFLVTSLSLRFFNSYCIFYTLLILPLVNFMSSYCIKFNCVLDRASELNEGNPLLAEHANMPKRRYLRFLQRHLMRMCCQCTCFMNGNDVT